MDTIIKRLLEYHRERSELYHVSPIENKDSILTRGLRAPVYLTPDYEYMLGIDPDFYDNEYSVFLVDISGLSVETDPEWDRYDDPDEETLGYICRDSITPSRISYLGDIKEEKDTEAKSSRRSSRLVRSRGFNDHKIDRGEL